MFDKIQFDRNAFDRSVSSDGLSLAIVASGAFQVNVNFPTPISISLSGSSALSFGLYASAIFDTSFSGSGKMNDLTVIFYQVPLTNITSSGSLSVNLTIKMPMSSNLSGSSALGIDNRVIIMQNLNILLSGSSDITIGYSSAIFFETVSLSSTSAMQISSMRFTMPLTIGLSGTSLLTLRRLSALNEKSFTLENINLLPGQTVIIDTDSLIVLFDNIEDVSSVTTDSIFFELNPGDNEITVNTDSNQQMNVTAIWQNRWL